MQNANKEIRPGIAPSIGEAVLCRTWRWVGERGLRVATGDQTLGRYALLQSQKFPEIEDMIVADGSLLLVLRRGAAVSSSLPQHWRRRLLKRLWLPGRGMKLGLNMAVRRDRI